MRPNLALYIVAIGVGVALLPLPYGYYQIMRWVVAASCAWLAVSAHRAGHEGWVWCWAVIAGVYNPLLPVHASRVIWSVVNIVTIAVAVWYGIKVSEQVSGDNKGREA